MNLPIELVEAADDLEVCPNCASEEWDRIDYERARERDVPFNRCIHCEAEWPVKE